MAPRWEHVPAEPFASWLNRRYDELEREYGWHGFTPDGAKALGPKELLAVECGWGDGEAALRRLYRYRNQRRAGSKNCVKGEFPAETFPRHVVEEALHHAGGTALLAELYPELAQVSDGEYAFCARCEETTQHDESGLCRFCTCENGHVHAGVDRYGRCKACRREFRCGQMREVSRKRRVEVAA